MDVLPAGVKVVNPEEMIIRQEEFAEIKSKMNDILSDLEWEVFMNYLDGKSYQETAVELNRHIKSIDNALQRVKRKVEKYKETHADDKEISSVYANFLSLDNRKKERKKRRETKKPETDSEM